MVCSYGKACNLCFPLGKWSGRIHTEILKNDALNEWFRIYPERFNNKTNGITPRRWLDYAIRNYQNSLPKILVTVDL